MTLIFFRSNSILSTFKKRMDALEEDDMFEEGDEAFQIDIDKLIDGVDLDSVPPDANEYKAILKEVAGVSGEEVEAIENVAEVPTVIAANPSFRGRLKKGCLSNYEDLEGYHSTIDNLRSPVKKEPQQITMKTNDEKTNGHCNKPVKRGYSNMKGQDTKTKIPLVRNFGHNGLFQPQIQQRTFKSTRKDYQTIRSVVGCCGKDEEHDESDTLTHSYPNDSAISNMSGDEPIKFTSRVIKTKTPTPTEVVLEERKKDQIKVIEQNRNQQRTFTDPIPSNNVQHSSSNIQLQSKYIDYYMELNRALHIACSASDKILQELNCAADKLPLAEMQPDVGAIPERHSIELTSSIRSQMNEKPSDPNKHLSDRSLSKEKSRDITKRSRSTSPHISRTRVSVQGTRKSEGDRREAKINSNSRKVTSTKTYDVLKSETKDENFKATYSHIHPCLVSRNYGSSRNLSVAEELHPTRILSLSDRDQLFNMLRKADQAYKRIQDRTSQKIVSDESSKKIQHMQQTTKRIHALFSSIQHIHETPLQEDHAAPERKRSKSLVENANKSGRFIGHHTYPSSIDAYNRKKSPTSTKPPGHSRNTQQQRRDLKTTDAYNKFINEKKSKKERKVKKVNPPVVVETKIIPKDTIEEQSPVQIMENRISAPPPANVDMNDTNEPIMKLTEKDKESVLNFIRSKKKEQQQLVQNQQPTDPQLNKETEAKT